MNAPEMIRLADELCVLARVVVILLAGYGLIELLDRIAE